MMTVVKRLEEYRKMSSESELEPVTSNTLTLLLRVHQVPIKLLSQELKSKSQRM